jgi:hypothetical protein
MMHKHEAEGWRKTIHKSKLWRFRINKTWHYLSDFVASYLLEKGMTPMLSATP